MSNEPTESDDALRVAREEIKRQAAEIAHWKNNHATEVRRARVLKERTDMPLERVRAYEQIGELRAEVKQLQHWKRAVDDVCAASWVAATDDARETVKALIARECQIALDPLVSSDAQALMDRGKEEAAAEIERLKTRLEVSPEHPYDGIASRDATIKLQDERIAELQADAARYRYIRSHRIGVKWCELYAGGPLLDEVIDSMMKKQADGEGKG